MCTCVSSTISASLVFRSGWHGFIEEVKIAEKKVSFIMRLLLEH